MKVLYKISFPEAGLNSHFHNVSLTHIEIGKFENWCGAGNSDGWQMARALETSDNL